MKKILPLLLIFVALLGLGLSAAMAVLALISGNAAQLQQAITLTVILFGLLLVVCITALLLRSKQLAGNGTALTVCIFTVLQALLLLLCFLVSQGKLDLRPAPETTVPTTTVAPTTEETTVPPTTEEETVPPTTEETVPPMLCPALLLSVAAITAPTVLTAPPRLPMPN